MKLLEKKSNNNFELFIESLEDMWILSQIIVENDMIFSTTQRKVKLGDDNSKQIIKIIFVELKVKKVIFENSVLKVSGLIQNETQFTSIGQSHTLNFNVNDKIKINKNQLLKFEEDLLEKSFNSKNSHNLLVLLDKDELLVSEFNNFNFNVFFHKKGLGEKKYVSVNIDELKEKYDLIQDILNRDYSNIIFAGPGIYKDKFKKYVEEKIAKKIITLNWYDVNSFSVQKVIKEISVSNLLEETELSKENQIISKLLSNIEKNNKYAYGFSNVSGKINEGSVEVLLISTKFIDERKEDNSYLQLNHLMLLCEKLNGSLQILNSQNEPGKILDGLSGIATLLRF